MRPIITCGKAYESLECHQEPERSVPLQRFGQLKRVASHSRFVRALTTPPLRKYSACRRPKDPALIRQPRLQMP
jgi:hypothetical protein